MAKLFRRTEICSILWLHSFHCSPTAPMSHFEYWIVRQGSALSSQLNCGWMGIMKTEGIIYMLLCWGTRFLNKRSSNGLYPQIVFLSLTLHRLLFPNKYIWAANHLFCVEYSGQFLTTNHNSFSWPILICTEFWYVKWISLVGSITITLLILANPPTNICYEDPCLNMWDELLGIGVVSSYFTVCESY